MLITIHFICEIIIIITMVICIYPIVDDCLLGDYELTQMLINIQELLKCCVSKCVEKLPTASPQGGGKKKMATKVDKRDPLVGSIQAAFR